jgi:hypothetical protein
MAEKSVEQRLYEAYQKGSGLRLSSNEVLELVTQDDAMAVKITDRAALEAGVEEPGEDMIPRRSRMYENYSRIAWDNFKTCLRNELTPNEEIPF